MKVTGLCRGSGKVFLRVEFSAPCERAELSVSCGKGFQFTGLLYPFGFAKTEYVASIPQLAVDQSLTFTGFDQQGNVVDKGTESIKNSLSKVQSRVNYLLHSGECAEIRDFDELFVSQRIVWAIDEAVPGNGWVNVRGIVRAPYREDFKLVLKAFNDKLVEIDTMPIIMAERVVPGTQNAAELHRELVVSVRVPMERCGYFFMLSDGAHADLWGYEFLELKVRAIHENTFWAHTWNTDFEYKKGYHKWFVANRASKDILSEQRRSTFEYTPLFSIIVPLYKTPVDLFNEMVGSVRAQTYGNWELILVNSTPDEEALKARVDQVAAEESRIVAIDLPENLGIAGNTNHGIAVAKGDFVCFFDHDDLLEPDILFEYAKAINKHPDTDMLYCDEDNLNEKGVYIQARFKPDFSLDHLRNNNYVCHMLSIRKTLLDQLELSSKKYDGAQDHDLSLKAAEKARYVHHVDKLLYHWRMSATSTAKNPDDKPYANTAGIAAVQAHLDRMGIPAEVSLSRRAFTYRVKYLIGEDHPLVSLIIPSCHGASWVEKCVASIVEKTAYDNYEIIVVGKDASSCPDGSAASVRFVACDGEDEAPLMNEGAAQAQGSFLVFLSDFVEVDTPEWIEEMLGLCQREGTGAVGCRLIQKDGAIYSGGVGLFGQEVMHIDSCFSKDFVGYMALGDTTRNLLGVSAACLMTSRDAFAQTEGFTCQLTNITRGLDYCLQLKKQGLCTVFTPEAEVFYGAWPTRAWEKAKKSKLLYDVKERAVMMSRWPEVYAQGDPYLNHNMRESNPGKEFLRV